MVLAVIDCDYGRTEENGNLHDHGLDRLDDRNNPFECSLCGRDRACNIDHHHDCVSVRLVVSAYDGLVPSH